MTAQNVTRGSETNFDAGKTERKKNEFLAGPGRQIEALVSECVVPHCFLVVPIDQVSLLVAQHVKDAAEVTAIVDLVTSAGRHGQLILQGIPFSQQPGSETTQKQGKSFFVLVSFIIPLDVAAS